MDGAVEIVTIWTGVLLAAKLKDARAYVGMIYFLPNILGVLLVNLLPWENKVGLLFGQWLTGTCDVLVRLEIDHITNYWDTRLK